MDTEIQIDLAERQQQSSYAAAKYLAAILPELAIIARKSEMDSLGEQIDLVADIARNELVRHRR